LSARPGRSSVLVTSSLLGDKNSDLDSSAGFRRLLEASCTLYIQDALVLHCAWQVDFMYNATCTPLIVLPDPRVTRGAHRLHYSHKVTSRCWPSLLHPGLATIASTRKRFHSQKQLINLNQQHRDQKQARKGWHRPRPPRYFQTRSCLVFTSLSKHPLPSARYRALTES